MRLTNIGSSRTIDEFVRGKLLSIENFKPDFKELFPQMFSEKTNVFFEKSEGFSIVKTTYGEAYQRILARSRVLMEELRDEPADSVVGLYMQNTMEWLLNFWAILASGHSVLLLNLRLDDDSLEEALKSMNVAAIVTDGKTFGRKAVTESELSARSQEIRKDVKIVGHKETTCPVPENELSVTENTAERFGTTFYMMTSGTSSRGKICGYTADKVLVILRNADELVEHSPEMKKHYKGELKQLTFLPFYHVFGMTAVYLWFAFFQRTFVELRDMAPKTILATIRRHEVTHIFAVPLFWDKVYEEALRTIHSRGEETEKKFQKGMALMDKLKTKTKLSRTVSKLLFGEVRDNLFGDSPSFLISGGGCIREEVLRFFNHLGYHLSNGYGMTEIGITSVELSDNPGILISGSVGHPVESVEYRVTEEGELEIRGTSLAATITEGPETKSIKTDEWFPTRDLCREEKERYFIVGRKDDLIVAPNGENLNPNRIEEKLMNPAVTGLCLTVMNRNGQKEPLLICSLSPDTTEENFAEKKEAVYEKIREHNLSESIEKIVFTREPLISGQEFKLNRKRLSRDYEAGKLPLFGEVKEESRSMGNEIEKTVRKAFSEALGKQPEEIGYETDFFLDEGGTSLDFFAVLSALHEAYQIPFPIVEGKTTVSMKELCEYIESQLGHGDSTF